MSSLFHPLYIPDQTQVTFQSLLVSGILVDVPLSPVVYVPSKLSLDTQQKVTSVKALWLAFDGK